MTNQIRRTKFEANAWGGQNFGSARGFARGCLSIRDAASGEIGAPVVNLEANLSFGPSFFELRP
jgi:hypothetical protein